MGSLSWAHEEDKKLKAMTREELELRLLRLSKLINELVFSSDGRIGKKRKAEYLEDAQRDIAWAQEEYVRRVNKPFNISINMHPVTLMVCPNCGYYIRTEKEAEMNCPYCETGRATSNCVGIDIRIKTIDQKVEKDNKEEEIKENTHQIWQRFGGLMEKPNYTWELIGEAVGDNLKECCDNYAKDHPEFAKDYDPNQLTLWGMRLELDIEDRINGSNFPGGFFKYFMWLLFIPSFFYYFNKR